MRRREARCACGHASAATTQAYYPPMSDSSARQPHRDQLWGHPRMSPCSSDRLLTATKRFDVRDQLHQIAFTELSRKIGHDRRVPGHSEAARVENAIS